MKHPIDVGRILESALTERVFWWKKKNYVCVLNMKHTKSEENAIIKALLYTVSKSKWSFHIFQITKKLLTTNLVQLRLAIFRHKPMYTASFNTTIAKFFNLPSFCYMVGLILQQMNITSSASIHFVLVKVYTFPFIACINRHIAFDCTDQAKIFMRKHGENSFGWQNKRHWTLGSNHFCNATHNIWKTAMKAYSYDIHSALVSAKMEYMETIKVSKTNLRHTLWIWLNVAAQTPNQ